jgi:ABC-type multidrug transport system fused ATPase/permease subunit
VNKENYNDQTIVRYLLGSLPENEIESVEELSFIDDEFAVRLNSVENDLVDDYVSGRLSGEKLERFDSYYLTSPRRRKKVKTAQALQAYAEKAVATGQVVFAPEPSQTNFKSVIPSPRLTNLFFSFRGLALTAVSVLVMLGIGWLIFELFSLRSQVNQAQKTRIALEQREKDLQELVEEQRSARSEVEQELERMRAEKERVERQRESQIAGSRYPASPAANPKILPFRLSPPARSAGQVQKLSLLPATDFVILQAELEPDDYPGYNAELLSLPGKMPIGWISEKLKSRAMGESRVLDIAIPANILKPGEYFLRLTGISDKGVAEGERGYQFKVVK